MSRGCRAGLLYGERGVGKSALIRAGLMPRLAASDVITLYCQDVLHPLPALARALADTTGLAPEDGEDPISFIDRVVTRALPKQQFVFVLDHMEAALAAEDDAVMSAMGDLFARVVTRSAGRGRFLFCCDSAELHRFGVLEQRTGSLFPPTSRYQLLRIHPQLAQPVLAQIFERHRVPSSLALAHAMMPALADPDGLLPADLDRLALAVRALAISSTSELDRIVGKGPLREQLWRAWIRAGANATGHEQSALAMLGEIAAARPEVACTPGWLAARLGLQPDRIGDMLTALGHMHLIAIQPGVAGIPAPDPAAPPAPQAGQDTVALAHDDLAPLVLEMAAPALASIHALRGMVLARLHAGRALSPRQYWQLRRARFTPATSDEHALLVRTKRIYRAIAIAAVAAPLALLLGVYIANTGRYYFDVATPPDGGATQLVVRAGRPGLSAFHWLPASPGFGDIIAEPGVVRAVANPDAWTRARAHELTGARDGDAYASDVLAAIDGTEAALIRYAIDGDGAALSALQRQLDGPRALTAALVALAPLASGGSDEVAFIEQALNDTSSIVQGAALAAAASAAQRDPSLYRDTLARALAASDPDLRRLAFSAVRELDPKASQAAFQAALSADPDADARRELLAEVTAIDIGATPSAAAAASILANSDISERTRQAARTALRRAFASDPKAATEAAAALAGNADAQSEDRILALTLMRDRAPEGIGGSAATEVSAALASDQEAIRAAALPVYARVAPEAAAGELAVLLGQTDLSDPIRVAMATAWGEVARQTKESAAIAALSSLIEDESPPVRTAAAEAYGHVGRAAQSELVELAKTARFDVASGAVLGLANGYVLGAPRGPAMSGISHLWRRKGRPRRAGAAAFTRMAGAQPRTAYSYLTTAVRTGDDEQLRIIGAEGLCRAGAANHRPSARMLIRASLDEAVDVRRVIAECVADYPLDADTTTTIAARLARDGDANIRADAARALTRIIAADGTAEELPAAILRLVGDRDREVRAIAIRALASMGTGAPEGAAEVLSTVYDRADESERLTLLATARAIASDVLIPQAIIDRSSEVRIAALDTAIATGSNIAQAMNAALTDSDPNVRRAALLRLAEHADKIERDTMDKALRLSLRDRDPAIARTALTTLVHLGTLEDVKGRLQQLLSERSEAERVDAAVAAIGLVERDPKVALEVLEPVLGDPSHDVRRAALPALAATYAATYASGGVAELAERLRASERHAMRRLVATAAFVHHAERARDDAQAGLEAVIAAEDTPPLARLYARIGRGLIERDVAGLDFLAQLVP